MNNLKTFNFIQNNRNGFTLIELLIAATAVGAISLISIRLLFSTVLTKARQTSIQTASQDVQNFITDFSDTVRSAKRINVVSATEMTSEGDICVGYKLNAGKIEKALIETPGCSSIDLTVYKSIVNENTTVDSLSLIKTDSQVSLTVSGYVTDAFGKHQFSYATNVLKRTD